jgi:ATP-dependent helicase HrpA
MSAHATVDAIEFPPELPITSRRDELIAAIRDHQVVIVAGETGSGKSTQLPKLCLAAGRGTAGMIGHTQPRRVAARTVADRIADELGVELGTTVGYSVRFTDRVGADTRIRLMTDGIALAELARDPELRRYDTIIIDEAHERSLNVDFLLGYLRQLLPRRPDLHVIVTSATIDTERFAEHFAAPDGTPAPVFVVEGRTYPVEVRYRPVDEGSDQVQAIIDAIAEIDRSVDGDVLVFLSGEREIHDTADAIRALDLPRTEVLPLYARLSAAEQHRVFAPHPGRRIVLATNVAETSITVPGVRAVVDTGTARISRYSKRLKVQQLPIEAVSQASAAQRAGRCGRVAPGVCIRLWSEEEHADRPEFTEPEILRTNLASVILQMTALGLGDVAEFPFVERPDASAVRDGYALLDELGALRIADDGARRLTGVGRRLARLPVDPRLGRMILEAERHGCVREVLVIASALSIQDVRERPREHRERADELHRRFDVPGSDLLSIVALWDHLRDRQRELSGNAFRRMCRDEYLNWLRVREWRDLYSQLRQVAGQLGIRPGTEAGHPDRVHQAVLAGLLSHLGVRDERSPSARGARAVYLGARGSRFEIAGGSVLARRGARWVMAAELVETDRLRARRVAAIQPEWAERLAPHLVRRSHGEPEWDPSSGRATVAETVTLYGLPIVAGRRVGLDRVDADLAHEMFVDHALVRREVERGWLRRQRFLARNDTTLDRLDDLGHRVRRSIGISDDELVEHYGGLVPVNVTSIRSFDRWWADARRSDPGLLDIERSPVLAEAFAAAGDDRYPDEWIDTDGAVYQLTYRHDPDSVFDGVTLHVPLTAVNRFSGDLLDWHIPAHRPAIAEALFRSLPKETRRQLIPAAETLAAALAALPDPTPGTRLVDAFAAALSAVSGVRVDPATMSTGAFPTHLRIHLVVSDADGEVHAFGDDLSIVRDLARPAARRALASTAPIEERSGIVDWDIGDLPDTVEWGEDGDVVRAHPTLLDRGDSVSLRLVTEPALQHRLMREGVRRLLLLTAAPARSGVRSLLDNEARLTLGLTGHGVDGLLDDAATATVDRVLDERGVPWTADAYDELRRALRAEGPQVFADCVGVGLDILRAAGRALHRLETLRAPAAADTVRDAHDHLLHLVGPGFVSRAGTHRLPDVHRYVRGIEHRLDHLAGQVDRDRRRMAEVRPLEDRQRRLIAAFREGEEPADLVEAGWLLEELRIATFAQPLGARPGASAARIARLLG